jgi:hypothetical protein
MSEIVYLIFFLTFLAIVVALRVVESPEVRRRLVTNLVVYILLVHAVLAASHRDAWPFATHGAFLEKADENRPLSTVRFVAVDRDGREHRIDPYSWSPLHDRTLATWWLINFDRLKPQERQRAMAFLLDKAEETRRLRISGRRIGPQRILGFLAAPFWYCLESSPPPPDVPYERFRAYLVTRTPKQKISNVPDSALLLAEYGR